MTITAPTTARERAPVRTNVVVVCGLIVMSMFISDGGGADPIDALMAIVIGHTLFSALSANREVRTRPQLLAIGTAVVILLAVDTISTIALEGPLGTLFVDVVSFVYLFVPLYLLGTLRNIAQFRPIWVVLAGSALAFSVVNLIAARADLYRPSGLMANPNMAGAWLGGALLLLVARGAPGALIWRAAAAAAVALALLATDSYAALLGLAIALAYMLFTWRHRFPALLLSGVAAAVVYFRWSTLDVPAPTRLAHSEGIRAQIWKLGIEQFREHPLGIGHGNFVAHQYFMGGKQLHNDYLASLVEDGPLGLAALLLLSVVLWRCGGTVTRPLLIFFAFEAFFHDILNFRHVWIYIALAIAYDRFCEGTGRPSETSILSERRAHA